jgi:hypothetical protein
MKKLLFLLFIGALPLYAQKASEQIYKEIALPASAPEVTLEVYNLLGSIKVEGYTGNKIILVVDKKISGKNAEKAIASFELGIETIGNRIQLFTKAPYDTRPGTKNQNQEGYAIHLNYSIKVPQGIHLTLSTVNSGGIEVAGVDGRISAKNINGAITATEVKMPADLQTVNGEIKVSYASTNLDGSRCKTQNGSIRVSCPPDVSADIQLKTMNGHYYTDFSEAEIARKSAVKSEKSGGVTRYKLNADTHLTLGKGESQMSFETMNGSIYIQKKI